MARRGNTGACPSLRSLLDTLYGLLRNSDLHCMYICMHLSWLRRSESGKVAVLHLSLCCGSASSHPPPPSSDSTPLRQHHSSSKMATAIAQNVAAAPGSPSASSPGGMGNPEWPPSLKAMVASAFAQVGARQRARGPWHGEGLIKTDVAVLLVRGPEPEGCRPGRTQDGEQRRDLA